MKNDTRISNRYCLAAWLAGMIFTLLKGIDRDPWGVSIFDLDLIVVLTGYLFLSFGSIQGAVFAVGQGLLMNVFSSLPMGLSASIHFGAFGCIYLGSLLFNLETAKGQFIIISTAVLMKWAMWQGARFFLYPHMVFSRSLIWTMAVAVTGTGLITPWLYAVFDRLSSPTEKENATVLDKLDGPRRINNR